MNAELKLGQLINGYAQRDATHVAVAPVMAANMLLPGQRIGLLPDGRASHAASSITGIVDPFLTHPVTEGQRFYLWLLPGTVKGMRHEWEHPAFAVPADPAPPAKTPIEQQQDSVAASVAWLTDKAPLFDMTYDGLMRTAREYLESGRYVTEQGSEGWRSDFYAIEDEFWKHYEIATGTTVPADDRGSPFSCSC